MNENPLNPRQKKVLTAIVDHYIVKAEPVSSGMLSQNAVVRASSATIRNTMAELEDLGMVEQPHTSSGRLPTDLGYRTYVDELMHPEPLQADDRQTIDRELTVKESLEARLARAAKTISEMTRLLGLVIPPPSHEATFKKISLVPVEEGKVLLVLTSSETEVRSLLLESGSETSIFRLETLVNRLNRSMEGKSVSLLNNYIDPLRDQAVSRDETQGLEILSRSILKLTRPKTGDEVFVYGVRNLLGRPDFSKIDEISSVLELMESKVTLVHLLRQKGDVEGVHVTVGEEHTEDGTPFRSLSLVTSGFTVGGAQGVVGVLGPKRIPYARLIPVVGYAARALSRANEKGME
jgi:heat-inducible transcriptional repressor